jgi:hypothetical protein
MFSNKFERRAHAFALDFVFYNFAAIMRPLGADALNGAVDLLRPS